MNDQKLKFRQYGAEPCPSFLAYVYWTYRVWCGPESPHTRLRGNANNTTRMLALLMSRARQGPPNVIRNPIDRKQSIRRLGRAKARPTFLENRLIDNNQCTFVQRSRQQPPHPTTIASPSRLHAVALCDRLANALQESIQATRPTPEQDRT